MTKNEEDATKKEMTDYLHTLLSLPENIGIDIKLNTRSGTRQAKLLFDFLPKETCRTIVTYIDLENDTIRYFPDERTKKLAVLVAKYIEKKLNIKNIKIEPQCCKESCCNYIKCMMGFPNIAHIEQMGLDASIHCFFHNKKKAYGLYDCLKKLKIKEGA